MTIQNAILVTGEFFINNLPRAFKAEQAFSPRPAARIAHGAFLLGVAYDSSL